jgi:hypothetical protein
MRQSLGTVFARVLGVTLFGLVFTPVFHVVTRRLSFLGRPMRRYSDVVEEPKERAA